MRGTRRAALRLLQATAFVSTMDRFAMPPMMIVTARALHAPLSAVVHTASIYFLAYGLMQPIWGVVSDRLGRVRTLRVTLLVAAFASGASACVVSVTQLTVARGLAGACFSAAIPSSLIYVGDTVPTQRRQTEITNLMAGVALGTALASGGAGALAQLTSWRLAFVVTAACALVLVLLLGRLDEPVTGRAVDGLLAPLARVARSRGAMVVLLLAFVEGGVLLGTLTLLPAAVESTGVGTALAGAVTAVYGAAVLLFARLAGALSRRWPAWRLIALGAVAALAACTLAAISRQPAAAAGVAVLVGLAWSAMHSSLQTWATQVLPSARATVVSLFAGALFAGSALASALVAGPAETGQFATAFGWTAAVCVPLGVLATATRARWRPVPDAATDVVAEAGVTAAPLPAGGSDDRA
jgi:predicted MFS family arabinose efflux permease